MKNFFKKMRSYSFWVSFSGALIILLNALGRAFGFEIESKVVEDCVMSVAGILVVLGIVTMKDKTSEKTTNETSDEQKAEEEQKDDKNKE